MKNGMDRRTFGRRLLGLGLGAAATTSPLASIGRVFAASPPARTPRPLDPLRVDPDRLVASFEGLARIGATTAGGVNRTAYSDADLEGRAYFLDLMRSARLETRIDAAGNLMGRREGTDPDLPPILFGSHVDSVLDGGRFDGPAGSIASVEAAHAIHDAGIATRHPIEVVAFQNEEGGLYGSRLMVGEFRPEEWSIVSSSGLTIEEGTRRIGGDPDRIGDAVRRPSELSAFLEMHIEQGGILESDGIDIGVVEGIVGIRWWEVEVVGFANHAGTTPMDHRQDALLAAARYVETVNRVVRSHPGAQVGTVGRISAEPGAPNVIPGRVRTSLEIRDLDMATIESLHEEIRAATDQIARETGTEFSFELTVDLAPALVDDRIQGAIEASAGALGLSRRRMPSGAGHDAQSMARITPIGMLFVPSAGGVSHSPEEFTEPGDMVNGANVLLNTVLHLDRELD